MKTALLSLVLLLGAATLAACSSKPRPAASHDDIRSSHQRASGEAEKSFDKENPANPAAMQAAPAK